MSAELKCVLFDLDGTLVDTAPDLGHAANCVRADLGMAPLPLPDYRPVASAGARGLLKVALGIAPDDSEFPQRRDAFLAYYEQHITRASRVFDGLDEVLRKMEQRGILWGVVTNKPGGLTKLLMDQLHLSNRAACSYSPNPLPAKPAPDMLFAACEQLKVNPAECLYVGDDLRDIVAGRAADMRTVAVGWGYFGEGGPIENWGADTITSDIKDFAALLKF